MTFLQLLIKCAPYIFYISSLIFILVLASHLKNVRRKDMLDDITIGEDKINEDYSHYGDTDVLTELNKLESSTSITPKKE